MSLTKKRKKILLIAISAVVVIAAVAVILFLLLQPKEEEGMRLESVSQQGDGQACRYQVVGGPDYQAVYYPLAFYGFTPPEGYVHTQNAEEQANRFSISYHDEYSGTEDGIPVTISFGQSVAYNGYTINFAAGIQPLEIRFGNLMVLYGKNENSAFAYWLYQDSLLSIAVNEPISQNKMLGLVKQVDTQTVREPIYSPLNLQRGGRSETLETKYFTSTGNPEIPDPILPFEFAQLPKGFQRQTAQETAVETLSPFFPEIVFTYQNEARNTITLTHYIGGKVLFSFDNDQLKNPDITDRVLDVTVGEYPGFYYQIWQGAQLIWVQDYFTMELDYQGQITQEEMLALAESLVQKPMEETSSTLSSE